ncbi:MAG: hypothetical protein R6V05_10015 [Candidatus Brocadiia bacterium]
MFIELTDAGRGMPVMVNLDRLLYAYERADADVTVLVFGKVAASGKGKRSKLRPVALMVEETLREIQEKRRLGS